MLIGRFDFAKKIFQKALGSISTAMNDIQSELLPRDNRWEICGNQFDGK
jgi:hypothetical protein